MIKRSGAPSRSLPDTYTRGAFETVATRSSGLFRSVMFIDGRAGTAALHFEAPCGGESEVRYALDLDGGPDRRAATAWTAQRVETALRTRRTALATCRHGDRTALQVTLYVAPDGTVAAAGAPLASHEALALTECVLREVQALHLPTPGSWYARTTVTIP